MSNNSTPATGVTGNTNIPQQQHAAAGASATTNRVKSFAKNNKVLVGALVGVAIYTVITVFVSNDMGLGGLLVTLFLLRYAYKQYEKNSNPTIMSLVGHLITAIIALVIIASPFVQKPLEGLNWAAKELEGVNMETVLEGGCPETQEVQVGETFVLRKGCVTRLRVSDDNANPHYQMTKPIFAEPFDHYVTPAWAGYNLVELDPIEEAWPEGAPNETRATLLTAEAAAEIAAQGRSGGFELSPEAVAALRAAAQ